MTGRELIEIIKLYSAEDKNINVKSASDNDSRYIELEDIDFYDDETIIYV